MNPSPSLIAFPARRLVERDVKEGLFKQVMDFTDQAAAFLDGEGRTIRNGLTGSASVAYSVACTRLTTGCLELAGLMWIAKAWVQRDISCDDATTKLRRIRLPPSLLPRDEVPQELHDLCVKAEALAARVRGAEARLRRALEQQEEAA